MCGIVAKTTLNSNINIGLFRESCELLNHRGPDQTGYALLPGIVLGHKRLSIMDVENGLQPMNYEKYTMVYNGEIYNTSEIKGILSERGYTFETSCDTEVLLKAYHCFKEKCVEILNGIYSFLVTDGENTFIARDRLGVKPLFYTIQEGDIFVASELKSILNYYKINKIDTEGISELIGLGPSRTPGKTPFKEVKELREGHYMIHNKNGITVKKYWELKDRKHELSFEETVEKVKELLFDAINKQSIADVPLATFLSGGLDSSLITAVIAGNKDNLCTYSVDYEESKEDFVANEFQVSKDSDFVNLVVNHCNTNHKNVRLKLDDLATSLEESMKKRDLPGMADIDSSLLLFSKTVKEKHKVALSGECADEIFGGYPWFYKEKINGFPWLRSIDERINLLNDNFKSKDIKKYIKNAYEDIIEESNTDDEDKQMMYINVKYFMQTLLERKDRMTMGSSLEVRVPFSDHRLVEFLYNVPFEYKFYNGQEKGLLREIAKDLLPEEIVYRKKSPYPKTHSKEYTMIVKKLLEEAIKDKESILHDVFNTEKIMDLVKTNGDSFKVPWFGQLMTGPQLIAYLYQFHLFGKEYNIKIIP